MKIKTLKKSYQEVMALKRPPHKKPVKPWFVLRTLVRVLSHFELRGVKFSYKIKGDKALPKTPALILMNHSSFLDLKIASKILYPKPYGIVCTSDTLVGKPWLMRHIGCIPTQKFVSDMTLIKDMRYALGKLGMSVLMYPEAGYSFDGCTTTLPEKLGGLFKLLKVPVVMITTYGAFSYDPLYNGLRTRKVKVTAEVECLFTAEDVTEKSVEELDEGLNRAFGFDNFAWQMNNKIEIAEPFRATGLDKVLYKCPECLSEGSMKGEGEELVCTACQKKYRLTKYGMLDSENGESRFSHIPDWYRWERECVKEELEKGSYLLDVDVEIYMMVDYKAVYEIGSGHLRHDENGFLLISSDGKLSYTQKPLFSYGVCADFYWYEKGDVINIGNKDAMYYCLIKESGKVAKTRLATEELYKKLKQRTNK